MLTRQHRQEGLSRAYIQAVVSLCGYSCSSSSPDYGIDLTVNHVIDVDGQRSESGTKLDLQAKSTTTASVGESHVAYDLEAKTHNKLHAPTARTPRILVVVVLPEDEAEWVTMTEEHLLLRKCGYWMSLRGEPATNNLKAVRVRIPRANVFWVESLRQMMDNLHERGQL